MTTHQRTQAQAVMDVRYACHYGAMNERYWMHWDTTLNLVGALGGSAAVAALLAANLQLSAAAGVAMALASALQLVLRPLERAYAFRDARRQFIELDAQAWDLSLTELDARYKRLHAAAPVGSRWLRMPAWNECVTANGHSDQRMPLTRLEKWAAAMA